MAATVEQRSNYPFESFVDEATIRLAAHRLADDKPGPFLERSLTRPRRTADQLRALMAVVQARHYIPPAMLTKILREADPIVTAGEDLLRFEGFSACCGVHARVDLLPAALGPGPTGRGTTNVDFNPPMLAALARIRASDKVSIAVGSVDVTLRTGGGEVVEKKVQLPLRWLRGLVEVQAIQSRMERAFTIEANHAFRFLRSLPRGTSRRQETFLQSTGAGLRVSRIERPGAIAIGGLERLRPLESLVVDAQRLVVFSDRTTGASAWVLEFDDSRLTLTLSPGIWRGFSGEGQALSSLASTAKELVPRVRAELAWGNTIDVDELALRVDQPTDTVEATLHILGTQGIVGFDLATARYFHRELPFDLSAVEDLQPRLVAARKLIAADAVTIVSATDGYEVVVSSSDVEHRIVASGEPLAWTCTCPWFAKNGTGRGPCKHVLAAQITTAS